MLQLDPDTTLHFTKTPTTTTPSRTLKLSNLHSSYLAFKVKTTAPKSYLVRPSTGTLRPRETQEVQIILQSQGADTGASNHRFLVQAIPVSSPDPLSREQWAEFPTDRIQEQRLNVVLDELPAEPAAIKKPSESIMSSNTTPAAAPVAAATLPRSEGMVTGVTAADQPADLKVKYEELVQHTLLLEKDMKKLEAEMASLQAAKGASGGDAGYSLLQILTVAVVAFLLSYLAKFLG